ncbi:MAG: GNAT family N-acetyltransferase [Burkholderiales bacterium]|nr:GNAT family N-acetyltransferase [Burkholderiales bacterium]
MNPLIRLAQPQDLEGILVLYRELRPNDPVLPAAEARAALARVLACESQALVVCEQAGELAATCMLAVVTNLGSGARPFGVIENVVTSQRFRQQGLGRAVLQHTLNLAWARGCYKVMLLSGEQRTDAHRVYEAVGFRGGIERGFVAKP